MSAIQHLITEHLDIWTAADTGPKSGRGRSAANAAKVYGISKLRELILELAVRGKLVPQDADDEPASELLRRIQAEKARLVAEGKIKKDKAPSPITDEEKPFELPQGWEWIRLSEIVDPLRTITYGVLKPGNEDINGVPLVKTENVYFNEVYTDFKSRISTELDIQYKRTKLIGGEILLTLVGSIGRCAVAPDSIAGANLSRSVGMIVVFNEIEKKFITAALTALINDRYVSKNCAGTAQTVLNIGTVNDLEFPLPPLIEQQRIVAKIDELMALCDQLESEHNNATEAHEKLVSHLLGTLTQSQSAEDFGANWQRIATHFDTLFTTEASIDALKQTLLQLAVMGKLVPQNSSDEPASELLKRIQAEKTKLIAEGAIRKDKPLAQITDEERPFSLPRGWVWVRLADIIKISSGDGLTSEQMDKSGKIPVYGGNGVNGYHSAANVKKPTLVIGRVGYYCGSVHITPEAAWVTDNAFITRFSEADIYLEYLYWLLRITNLKENEGATAQPVISGAKVYPIVVALPPLSEQHRIVAKVDELMNLCDQLRFSLIRASQVQQMLADVMVNHAVVQ